MKGEGDIGLGAGTHEGGAGTAVPAEADDAVEVVQGDAELGLFFVAYFDSGPVFAKIGTVQRDE